jgi:lysozyme family protein
MDMTEQARFDRCLAVVLRLEGGYADDPRDAGGPTNRGVTLAELGEALGHEASARDLEALTPAEAGEIYRARYWAPSRCADLAAGLDLMMLDTAVNMGPGAAARLLQETLGLQADGALGPRTLAAAGAADPARTIGMFAARRAERYRRLAGFSTFGRGWLNRLETVRAQAMAWAAPAGGGQAA